MPSPVVHFEIRSSDPDATRSFFGKLFGWTFPDGDSRLQLRGHRSRGRDTRWHQPGAGRRAASHVLRRGARCRRRPRPGHPLRIAAVRRLGGHIGLAGASAGTLARHDHTVDQQLAAPDTPGLPAPDRTGQAGLPGPASLAQGLGLLYIPRRLGEEQLRTLAARMIRARQERGNRGSHAGARVPGRASHHRAPAPVASRRRGRMMAIHWPAGRPR